MFHSGLPPRVPPSPVIDTFYRPGAAHRLETFRRRWLTGTSALRIPIASAALVLGVALSDEAHAQATVDPNQVTTYTIAPASNPITFGSATNIATSATPGSIAVYGQPGTSWNVTVADGGRLTSRNVGLYLNAAGTLTNGGSIAASGGANSTGVLFSSGGSITNQTGGTISGQSLGVRIRGAGRGTNARIVH